jgi:hypothetical protein
MTDSLCASDTRDGRISVIRLRGAKTFKRWLKAAALGLKALKKEESVSHELQDNAEDCIRNAQAQNLE